MVIGKVRGIVVEQLGMKMEEVTEEGEMVNKMGADELDMVEIQLAIEEDCDVVILDKEWEGVVTVGDIVTAVMKQLKEKEEGNA